MTPFTVTWRLKTPICLSAHPLHLDGLLAWAAVDRLRRKDPASNYILAKEDLPLQREQGEGADFVWKASALYGTPLLEPDLILMIRRTDESHFAHSQGKIFESRVNSLSTGTGQFRNYSLRQSVQWFDHIQAHGVGDIDAVKDLLSTLRGIGKITRNGFGRIISTEVRADPEAAKLWVRRNLPESLAHHATDGHALGTGCIQSPYWDRAAWQDILAWHPPVPLPQIANVDHS